MTLAVPFDLTPAACSRLPESGGEICGSFSSGRVPNLEQDSARCSPAQRKGRQLLLPISLAILRESVRAPHLRSLWREAAVRARDTRATRRGVPRFLRGASRKVPQ